ncbi:MAG: IS481 family transposase [Candidatus Halalkalibacterium sp. M3_1C_030]
MPWKIKVPMLTLRKEFVQLADRKDRNMSRLCRRFGISRKTGYKWLRRWQAEGEAGLQDRGRRPKHSPNQTSRQIVRLVLELQATYSEWGARKLRMAMLRKCQEGQLPINPEQVPAASTILAILKRNNRWQPHVYGPSKDRATQRFEREAPNQLWQLDFKGEFLLLNQRWCYPMTLLDDHSRFNLSLRACSNYQTKTVQAALTATFRRYGLPEAILTDNGSPWGSSIRDSQNNPYHTKLEAWLIRLGVRVIHSRPGHPQTHGKNERFNGTLQAELLRFEEFRNFPHAQQRFDWWRDRYNTERPHQGIDDQVPIDRYSESWRTFPEQLAPIEYDQSDEIRKVNNNGYISYQATSYKIGKAFCGHPVALRDQQNSTSKTVYFCHQPIKEIHL